ncbi:MAG TPA: Mut7-C RNAse domain-containing protein [Desulfomonilaceae bacterium]|nr:Mut7-C RNAse domain-containing protein [Desulfomonilaceae bacterium]
MGTTHGLGNESPESFDVDGMLGRVAKWLRILGFDATYPAGAPSQGRFYVTTRRRIQYSGAIIVDSGPCLSQVKFILEHAGVRPDPQLILTRCLECNLPVQEVSPERVRLKVPREVFTRSGKFNHCPACGRVYWAGSHRGRIMKRLKESGIRLD